MKKSYYIALAFIASFLYWTLDAYANVSLYKTLFLDEFLLRSSHTLVFTKLLCVLLIFIVLRAPYFIIQKKTSAPLADAEPFKDLSIVMEILFSSLSTKINIIKSLEKIEELLSLHSIVLFLYTKDTITLYNENPFIQAHFRSKEVFPFRAQKDIDSIEHIATTCFLEKRLYSKDSFKENSRTYTAHSFGIKEERSDKLLGSVMLVSQHTDLSLLLIERYCEMLSYVLSYNAKKENLEKMDTHFSQENGHFDKALSIMNYMKLQESIEHEYKRQKRYHIHVTLLLIEINLLKNLLNVFPAELIVAFKKDFIALIRASIREVDVLGKWNNEQFAILMPNVDFQAAQAVAKKIKLLLEEKKFTRIGKITCSFGITSLSQKDTIGTFRLRAESALSLASSREGNAIEVKLLV